MHTCKILLLIGQGPSISSYMAQMDKELASTSLGSSFIKKTTTSGNDKPKVCLQFFLVFFNKKI